MGTPREWVLLRLYPASPQAPESMERHLKTQGQRLVFPAMSDRIPMLIPSPVHASEASRTIDTSASSPPPKPQAHNPRPNTQVRQAYRTRVATPKQLYKELLSFGT